MKTEIKMMAGLVAMGLTATVLFFGAMLVELF